MAKVTATQASLYKSIALHLAIMAVLLISVSFKSQPLPTPAMEQGAPVIKATFIDAQAIADKKREDAKAQAQAEAQARAEQEKKRRAQEAEKQRQRKIAAEREAKRKADTEAKKQKELDRLAAQKEKERKEKEAAAKAEAKRKKELEAKQKEMEQLMQEQLASERAEAQRQRSKQVLSEVERYQAMIQQTIMRYLIEDSSYKGKRCRLNIRLATTGLVTKVSIMEGDPALCRAAQSAVLKPNTLPMSDAPDVYEKLKDINLTVEL